jgi:hypothetical protein
VVAALHHLVDRLREEGVAAVRNAPFPVLMVSPAVGWPRCRRIWGRKERRQPQC